jgi:LysR family transcriptional activator of nhaA
MAWLNYNHLQYFWHVAREGGVALAAKKLRLTHSTLSMQMKLLEDALGAPLFEKRGRRRVLTPFGEQVADACDEIFARGAELFELAQGRAPDGRRAPLRVGVLNCVPKLVLHPLVKPGFDAGVIGQLWLREAPLDVLLADLATNRLHVVLTEQPPGERPGLKLHAHQLGEAEVHLYATPALAAKYKKGFPASLDGAPLLMPAGASALHRQLERWFIERGLKPRVVASIDDAATLWSFGLKGLGLFPVRGPTRAFQDLGSTVHVGSLTGLVERYYAITTERRLTHPGAKAIVESARRTWAPDA